MRTRNDETYLHNNIRRIPRETQHIGEDLPFCLRTAMMYMALVLLCIGAFVLGRSL